MAFLATR